MADVLLGRYPSLDPEVAARVVPVLVQRVAWAQSLLAAIEEGLLPPTALNLGQARRLLATGDGELTAAVHARWGRIRETRDPDREAVIERVRALVLDRPGDPFAGWEVFQRTCATCHTIYGEGAAVGPDLTNNGRSSFDHVLTSLLDPNLVVGTSYRTRTVRTTDGRVLAGLVVEDDGSRVVLRVEGGREEVLPRAEIELERDGLSMMPERLEEQLSEQELVDLLVFLSLDRPPEDPTARALPGSRRIEERESFDPAEFAAIVAEVAPGFSTDAVGDDGLALEAEHRGRPLVLRTHPVTPTVPCVLSGRVQIPAEGATLRLAVGHHERGDWRLVVRVEGAAVLETDVGETTAVDGWLERWIDLGEHAGRTVEVALENHATDWLNEYGYWGRVEVRGER